jgi:hypothetical protein
MNRRNFLLDLGSTLAAPCIVQTAGLMPLRGVAMEIGAGALAPDGAKWANTSDGTPYFVDWIYDGRLWQPILRNHAALELVDDLVRRGWSPMELRRLPAD